MKLETKDTLISKKGEPVWEIAYLFPFQGAWSEDEYLALNTNHLVEFSHGYLEFLPMPTFAHQWIALYLYRLLWAFVEANHLGWVNAAPLPVRLAKKKYREPDIIFISAEHPERLKGAYPEGADLVMEVVSGGAEDRERDLVTKRLEYAQAGITEYWIVDPERERITVLRLDGAAYVVYGEFGRGAEATSALLAGFSVDVAAVFDAVEEISGD